ncbi:MAG: serpin family protein [Deltaproteobacteria bacterium]|nr:serpin family protein [Nannocystaceae bacterium]
MTENKWWMTMAALCFTGCAAAADGSGEPASTSDTEAGDPTEAESTETIGEDGIDARVECSEHAQLTVSAEDLARNGRGDAAVGLKLLGALGQESDNVLLSPLSLRTAFGQVDAGASGASRTEIEDVFELTELGERSHDVLGGAMQLLQSRNAAETEQAPELIFRPANRSFFDIAFESSVNAGWLKQVQESYGVCFEYFDMNRDTAETRAHINDWVADQTHDMIPELVKFLPEHVSLVLVNALYFKASWETPFDAGLTTDRQFTTRSGARVELPMMRAPVLMAQYASTDGWEAVAIPYSNARLEMVVILPATSAATSFESSLDADALDGIFEELAPSYVDLALPKFDITSSWALRPALERLGMNAPFSNAADFRGIAEGMEPIFEVFHDVAIAIDEKGTEASAATAVVFGEDGGEESVAEHTVVVDRTFYVAIRDSEARSVLFFARIGNPAASE